MKNVIVIGGGSWGTAVANLIAQNGHKTHLYIRNRDQFQSMQKNYINERYLPGVALDPRLHFINNLDDYVERADIIVLGVPTNSVRTTVENIKDTLKPETILVNLSKGLEETSHLRISQVVEEVVPNQPFVALSGPSHAEEVAINIPTTVVSASKNINYAREVQDLCNNDVFRVYTQDDLLGVEMGSALKNIIALAAGLIDGMGYGDNTVAALMTRGIYEMTKLGINMGARPQTFQGLSGIGDLIVTCTSLHSRNRKFGYLIGEGKSVEDAMTEVDMVVEGYKTTKVAHIISREQGVEMPITQALYGVLYEGLDPKSAVARLMTRKSKHEIEKMFYE